MDVPMEVIVPMNEISAEEIINAVTKMGAKRIGGYGVRDPLGKGAKYKGGNMILMGEMYFLLIWDNENSKIKLEHIELSDKYVLASEMPIKISGLPGDEMMMFANKADAIEWLSKFQSYEVRKFTVDSGDYIGSAIMYRG